MNIHPVDETMTTCRRVSATPYMFVYIGCQIADSRYQSNIICTSQCIIIYTYNYYRVNCCRTTPRIPVCDTYIYFIIYMCVCVWLLCGGRFASGACVIVVRTVMQPRRYWYLRYTRIRAEILSLTILYHVRIKYILYVIIIYIMFISTYTIFKSYDFMIL